MNVPSLLRRFVVIQALMFWQGGFLFYAAVVVPLGQNHFGSVAQGFLTRQVTIGLNLTGLLALAICAWDNAAARRGGRLRWRLWFALASSLALLFLFHRRMECFLDPEAMYVADRLSFYHVHRIYLWLCTIQWSAALLYVAATLRAWRDDDRAHAPN